MFTKRLLFILIFLLSVLLAACSPAAAPPPAPSPTVPQPTDAPEALSEAASLVQRYYNAVNVEDLDTAMSFIAEEAVFINPMGSFIGKEEIRASLEILFEENITFEISNFRDTDGRVVYDYKVLVDGEGAEPGTDGLTIVKEGMIVFDGTERTERDDQAFMQPDPVTVVQSFFEARAAKDLDAAAALLDDDVRWRGTPYMTGKVSVLAFLQGNMDAGFTDEISDLRATRGRVTYTWTTYRNGTFQVSGEDTIVVENGKIVAIESYAVMGEDTRPEIAEVAFTASDSAFSGPDELEGGWVKLTLTNDGQEGHHLQLVKLEEGKTLDELNAALTANPEIFPAWSTPYGGPNAPDPGGTTSAIVYLEAGRYALIDVIPNAEGIPHFMHGMITTLTVTEPKGVLSGEPLADISVNLTEFAFLVSGELTPGEHIIRFNNAGKQVHEAFLIKLNEGATADDYLNTPPGEIPPAISLGGLTGLISGEGQYIPVTLEAGEYALFCFFPDPGTHAPHFVQGMMLQFTVE